MKRFMKKCFRMNPNWTENPPRCQQLFSKIAQFPVVGGCSSCFLSCVCSAYQVVVEEERPRRARGTAEILRCYPVPIHFQNATLLNSQYYFTAQFPAAGIHSPQPFTVGDNKTYNGYWNAPLLPQKSYSIYYQAVSTANGVGVSGFFFFRNSVFIFHTMPSSPSCPFQQAQLWNGGFI